MKGQNVSAFNPIISGKETTVNHTEYIRAASKYTPYDPKQAKAAARVLAAKGQPESTKRSTYVQRQRPQGSQETKTT